MHTLSRKTVSGIVLAAGLAAAMPVHAQDATESRQAHYTVEQADRGETRYTRDCAECHGEDLRGGLIGGPPLRGMSFQQKFANGAPAAAMFGFMQAAMPPNAPGRYTADVYADLMAYILQENGFEPGDEPLPSDFAELNGLVVGEAP